MLTDFEKTLSAKISQIYNNSAEKLLYRGNTFVPGFWILHGAPSGAPAFAGRQTAPKRSERFSPVPKRRAFSGERAGLDKRPRL